MSDRLRSARTARKDPNDLRTFLGMVPKVVTEQGGIGQKKRKSQKRAGARRWEEIRAHKLGPCRICGGEAFMLGLRQIQLHHLVPRAQGGSDTESNVVPLCAPCHSQVTRMDKAACAALRRSLTDAEYAYAVDVLGEARFEARYPVKWEKP